MSSTEAVASHYSPPRLIERLRDALDTVARDGTDLSPADLAPLDQFHTRGLAATADLAACCGITSATRALDVGSGLGGPSRFLAATYGCHVTGVDLSPSFVEAATLLATRAGLAHLVTYRRAGGDEREKALSRQRT